MGSLRSPVGPLPSSIYWRRRAVALSLFALLALLVIWAVNSGGGAGGDGKKGGASGNGPAESITPGPSSSGPAISERPGGRDESGNGDGNGSGSGGSGGSDSGATDGGSGADDGGGAGDGGQGSSAGGAGASGGSGGGNGVPAGTKLPDCGPDAVELKLHSVKNTYAPGEKPELEVTAENSSGTACEIDFGAKSAVLTITFADDDDPVWASDDCLRDSAGIRLRVPAGGADSYTVKWDRKPSEPECATPSGGSVRAGTYLAEAETEGGATAQASFVLAKD